MQVIRSINDTPRGTNFAVLTIGVFDGVHRGHQEILSRVVSRAREQDGTSMLLTFSPHPQKVISSREAPRLLQTSGQKEELLEELGIDVLLRLPFTRRLSLFSPEHFVGEILVKTGAREIHVGTNFRFGHRRAGDFHTLKEFGKKWGFEVFPTEQVRFRGERISSTRIRRLLSEGRVALARRLLGRPYQVRGNVIRGAARGARMGFPTANLKLENELIPAQGVFASRAVVEGKSFVAATNIGLRPTLHGQSEKEPTVEAHLLDYEGNLYGQEMSLEFCLRLRGERKFQGVEELRRQIGRDIDVIKRYASKIQNLSKEEFCR